MIDKPFNPITWWGKNAVEKKPKNKATNAQMLFREIATVLGYYIMWVGHQERHVVLLIYFLTTNLIMFLHFFHKKAWSSNF